MGVFENPLASLFGKAAEGMEQREQDNIDAMRALRRTLIAFAAFAMLVAVLDVTARDPQAIADRTSPVVAVR